MVESNEVLETIAMDSSQDCHWTPFERKTAIESSGRAKYRSRQYDSAAK